MEDPNRLGHRAGVGDGVLRKVEKRRREDLGVDGVSGQRPADRSMDTTKSRHLKLQVSSTGGIPRALARATECSRPGLEESARIDLNRRLPKYPHLLAAVRYLVDRRAILLLRTDDAHRPLRGSPMECGQLLDQHVDHVLLPSSRPPWCQRRR